MSLKWIVENKNICESCHVRTFSGARQIFLDLYPPARNYFFLVSRKISFWRALVSSVVKYLMAPPLLPFLGKSLLGIHCLLVQLLHSNRRIVVVVVVVIVIILFLCR